MQLEIERALEQWCSSDRTCIGQILIEKSAAGLFTLRHRDNAVHDDLTLSRDPEEAATIAKFDDAGNYRPLKTAPNLRHGWRMELNDVGQLRRALEIFYPGRLAVLLAFEQGRLATTPFRVTLERQSGMYRVAARILDDQANELIANFCRSDGGCLRTILWKRDALGRTPSTKLPSAKFEPAHDQIGRGEQCIPLLCQEACSLIVSAAREVVKRAS
jgi:sirohydrochlorin cobaltochelatase